ncbi:omega-hydroxypalmitate O-feruloyl transferase-like [Phoenix dactylifera]|uniref:Omega-hydroxypalmitate O-feruloyl transferase-like n=1 Tax=Phoenix dactylifera TaxID=42345 RepID=A0A8B7BVP5_PHODC|nr:omega-hydroxypalmitate O-feruloyl transferase-like [Phoenix dactylifera]
MEFSVSITDNDVRRGGIVSLVSPRNPTPIKTVYLSNIDQTVAFPVQTVFFYEVPPGGGTPRFDATDRVRRSVSEVLLIPYYFMAGRLNFNLQTKRLELVCNNAGVLFAGATSSLSLNELGNLSLPNPSFRHLVLQTEGFESLPETPIFTIQVTRFKCGGFSIGFVTNHSILDGRSAAEMFENLASICRGEGMKTHLLNIDRSCIRARDPPQIKFQHTEYTKLAEATSLASSFTSPIQPSTSTPLPSLQLDHDFRMLSFSPDMIRCLKEKAATKCSSFEAIVAHIWRARTKAVFDDPDGISSVLFAADIRSRVSPPLPHGFGGNAVITASASAKVAVLGEKPFSFCVGMVKEAIERVTDEYVRSVIDWLEVYRGVPSTVNGNFFLSAWWKLPFHELDFGYGKPLYGGPVVGGMGEFVLLLSSGNDMGRRGGVNVWIALEKDKMERFLCHVFEM